MSFSPGLPPSACPQSVMSSTVMMFWHRRNEIADWPDLPMSSFTASASSGLAPMGTSWRPVSAALAHPVLWGGQPSPAVWATAKKSGLFLCWGLPVLAVRVFPRHYKNGKDRWGSSHVVNNGAHCRIRNFAGGYPFSRARPRHLKPNVRC